jgi:MFS transporter, AAHS family, 4-hydroxybenzoate transporter
MTKDKDKVIDVAQVINDSPIGRFQYVVFATCMLIMLCDGFDTQAVAYVAPSIVSEWKLMPGSFGPVFSAVLLGSMIGAFAFGYVGDRLGRKKTLICCVIAFGMLNIANAYAASIESLAVLRFLCGIGLGGAIPNVTALVSEFAPARKRNTLIAMTWCGFALGAVSGGLVSVPLILSFGWPSVFVAGGVLPLCIAPLALFALPESIKFLTVTRANSLRIEEILRRIAPGGSFDAGSDYVLGEAQPGRGRFSALFKDGLAVGSILLCLAFFMSLMLVYLFISWIPLLLRQAGLPLQNALMGTIVFNLAGIFGSIACTQLIDRKVIRPIVAMIGAYFAGAVAVFGIGYTGTTFWLIMTMVFLSGFFIIGVQLSLNAFITAYYPTTIRGTGIGWSQVVGRGGSLIGPLVGGALVSQGISPSALFQVSAIAPLLACLALILFTRLSRRDGWNDSSIVPTPSSRVANRLRVPSASATPG